MEILDFFKALSDETRLRLLNLLLYFELNVNEIIEILNMGQSRISRHLKILTDKGLLKSRHNGAWTFYSTVTEGNGFKFTESIKCFFKKKNIFSQDLKQTKRVIENRSRETTRFFDSIAEDWGKLKKEIFGNFDLNRFILNHVHKTHTIVDLGCGIGDLLSYIKVKANIVIGVDKSPKMLEEAYTRFQNNNEKIDLRIGEIEHLPLKENEVDIAIINMVLHHLSSPLAGFYEINRVIKRGGVFIIVDFLNHNTENMRKKYGDRWLGFSKKQIEIWLIKTGFKFDKFEDFNLQKELKGFIIQAIKE